MRNKTGNLVLALLTVALAAPFATVFAHYENNPHNRYVREDADTYWDAYVVRETASYQKVEDKQYARLERERVRIEDRLQKQRARLCTRLERLARRLNIDLHLPTFCDDGDTSPSPTIPTLSLTATPEEVPVGATTTLAWSSTNATLCRASDGWSGDRAVNGSQEVAVTATTTYTLACGGSGGTTTKSVTVNVVPGTVPPVILPTVEITADPLNVRTGGTSTLSWTTANADYCEASGAGDWSGVQANSGSREVTVTATTTYTLACGNETGTTTTDVEVVAQESPSPIPLPTVDLSADPLSVPEGGTSTVSWNTTDADYCEASGGWTDTKALSGTVEVTVSATTTYTLACGNGTGTTTSSVEVTTVPLPVVVLNKVVLSEVLYDLANDNSQGTEAGNKNEWVELYNATAAAVDLNGWYLIDAALGTSTLATTSAMLGAGQYALVTNSTTTEEIWSSVLPGGTLVLVLPSIDKLVLNNTGESLTLYTPSSVAEDAVSWEGNQDAFDSTGLIAPAGSSIARLPVTTDTDSVTDWQVLVTPTPGS